MADLGESVFEVAMAYVALSRARFLKDVHLINFSPFSLRCNDKAVGEYNRLAKKYMGDEIIKEHNTIKTKSEVKSLKRKLFQSSCKNNELLINNKLCMDSYISNINEPRKKRPCAKETNKKPEYFLRLNNNSNGCYANVTVQALLSCGNTFYNEVKRYFSLINSDVLVYTTIMKLIL